MSHTAFIEYNSLNPWAHGRMNMERSFHKFIIELILMNEYKVIELGT